MKPIRILHVVGAMDYGGIETWLLQVLRRISREGIQIDFCCLSGRAGILAPEVETLGSRLYLFQLRRNLSRFNSWFGDLLNSGAYDIVHSHVHKFSGYILWRAARAGIRGRIAHSFTSIPRLNISVPRVIYERVMDYLIRRYATVGLGNSLHSISALFGQNWRSDPRWKILYCGIDLAKYTKPNDRNASLSRFGIPDTARLIGHLGRISPEKNHNFIIDIALEMRRRYRDVWFLLIGDGELREMLMEKARVSCLDNVVFAGRVSDSDAIAGLRNMDLLLFPSIREGLPQVVLEAQASGLRCLCSENITSEVAIMTEAIEFMSLKENATRWADSCAEAMRKPRLDQQRAVKIMANSHFNISRSVDGLVEIYRGMIC